MEYLQALEEEAIDIFREAYAQFRRPVLLFSGGKDSTLLIHLAEKAFYSATFPFPVLHIDTGHNFPEALAFRDELVAQKGLHLIVRKVEDTMRLRNLQEPQGRIPSRNALQSVTLLDTIREFGFDACIGGGRRDEEKSRAKERIFSLRDPTGAWQPYNQRPELWDLYNGRMHAGENMRVFPISNWTELDVWAYIRRERIGIPSLYFAHERACLWYHGQWIAVSEHVRPIPNDRVENRSIRYRTVGDMTCTAAVESTATSLEEVMEEIRSSQVSERGETRIDDRISDAGMEDRKLKGYF